MATGDLKNSIRKLQLELRSTNFSDKVDVDKLYKGDSTAYLAILHHILLSYSKRVQSFLFQKNYHLFGKSDLRFLDEVYKICRDVFSIKFPLSKEQFFSTGFAEQKAIMLTKIISAVKSKNEQLKPKSEKSSSLCISRAASRSLSRGSSNVEPRCLHGHEHLVDINQVDKAVAALQLNARKQHRSLSQSAANKSHMKSFSECEKTIEAMNRKAADGVKPSASTNGLSADISSNENSVKGNLCQQIPIIQARIGQLEELYNKKVLPFTQINHPSLNAEMLKNQENKDEDEDSWDREAIPIIDVHGQPFDCDWDTSPAHEALNKKIEKVLEAKLKPVVDRISQLEAQFEHFMCQVSSIRFSAFGIPSPPVSCPLPERASLEIDTATEASCSSSAQTQRISSALVETEQILSNCLPDGGDKRS